MKKIVSAIIICAMLLATLLAVVPASAADPTRDDLKTLIDAVEALDETKYTKVTWDALKKPLDEAKKVYDDATQPAVMVKISYQQLESVYKALKVDTKEIKALIEKAEDLVESDYTPESWTAFQAILDQVRIDSATNDVATVDAAIVTLTEALDTALVALPVEDAAVAELDELVKLAGLLVPTD